ncbi:hypothetical protein P7L53_00415 [Thermoleptolyngbya sichuanensis XZ-Cy5]|nr:hypothetical protein [Thermoleptolyngbya sichuanensis XZ-Cy5]
MVHWGRLVLRRTHPAPIFASDFENLPVEQRWRRVRAALSPQLLKALLGNLSELKRSQQKQRNLFDKDNE